jgi:hypothetical protein
MTLIGSQRANQREFTGDLSPGVQDFLTCLAKFVDASY